MLTVAEATRQILSEGTALTPQMFPLEGALGRRLHLPVSAQEDLPSFASSAMDGFALGSPSAQGTWKVIEEVAAGQVPRHTLEVGQCTRIFTGAMLPEGTWSVIPQEDCRREGEWVTASGEVQEAQNMRPAGEHCQAQEVLLPSGGILTSAGLGMAAFLGYSQLSCWPSPRVALLSTGDELVELDRQPGPAQLRNSNAYAMQAQVAACGAKAIRLPIVADDPKLIRRAIEDALQEADLLVTCGGASVGERDYVQSVLREMGADLRLWKVAMRPGKPLGFACLQGKPIVALPGNPVSCYVAFELFVRPLLDKLQGGPGLGLKSVSLALGQPVRKKVGLRFFYRCNLRDGRVFLAGEQGSHLFRSIAESCGLLELDESTESLPPGRVVRVLLWPWIRGID